MGNIKRAGRNLHCHPPYPSGRRRFSFIGFCCDTFPVYGGSLYFDFGDTFGAGVTGFVFGFIWGVVLLALSCFPLGDGPLHTLLCRGSPGGSSSVTDGPPRAETAGEPPAYK